MAGLVEVLDSDDEDQLPPFDAREWIGNNKTYPTYAPPELDAYCTRQLRIPREIKSAFPKTTLNVTAFLRVGLPAKSHALLPPKKYIEQLSKEARQAILDGKLSVQDSRYPNIRFSLWIIAAWRWLVEMTEAQEHWKAAEEWVNKKQPALPAADAAAGYLSGF
ncbi:hypothetical protein R3P38DRAFT_3442899 [Favolaschia claudopus]|uniref:Uncharacterized protein n=1 Tax=Favolaschia claudopus TaxID=2862362 RepID=A0AAV9ZQJ8_9AGAR